MGAWRMTAGVLATAGTLVLGAWWSTDRDEDVLRLRGGDLVTADEDIVTLGEVSARLADGWTSRVQVSVVTGQPERVRAGEETATAAVGLALSSLEHEELLGAAQTEGLRRLLLEVIQAALPDAEVERVLVTGLMVG